MRRRHPRTGVWIGAAIATLTLLAPFSRAEERAGGHAGEGSAPAAVASVAPVAIGSPARAATATLVARTSAPAPHAEPGSPASEPATSTPAVLVAPTTPAPAGSAAPASGETSAIAAPARSAAPLAAAPIAEAGWRTEQAEATVYRLLFAGDRVQRALRVARAHRGPATERQTCLDELLSSVHMAARAGREEREELALALAGGDLRRADLALVRIAALAKRIERLVAREATCGASAADVGAAIPGGSVVRVLAPRLPDAEDLPRLE
jgi:hypothetical protein